MRREKVIEKEESNKVYVCVMKYKLFGSIVLKKLEFAVVNCWFFQL